METGQMVCASQKRVFWPDNKHAGFAKLRPEKSLSPCYFLSRYEPFLAGNLQRVRIVRLNF
jgi:hypothetical protein